MSALPLKADIEWQSRNVCFVPILLQKSGSDHCRARLESEW